MKRLGRFFLTALASVTTFLSTAMPSLAASSEGSQSNQVLDWIAENKTYTVVIAIAVVALIVLIVIFAVTGKKKSPETSDAVNAEEKQDSTDTPVNSSDNENVSYSNITAAEIDNSGTENADASEAEFPDESVAVPDENAASAETEIPAEEPETEQSEVVSENTEEPANSGIPTEAELPAEGNTDEAASGETETAVSENISDGSEEPGKAEEFKEPENNETGDATDEVTPEFADKISDPPADRVIPEQAVDPETKCIYTFDANGIPVPPEGMVIRYKWSFLARLSQADAEVKYHYLTLRRTLLAYKKMRSNVSWNYDSYFVGRKQIAKLKIRGKNLVVYFPLDPKEMEGSKYIGEDASGISRYKAVPFVYRINGVRKLKYAIELIERLLDGKPDSEPEYINENDVEKALPYESFETLYNRELIRIGGFLTVKPGETALSDDDDE